MITLFSRPRLMTKVSSYNGAWYRQYSYRRLAVLISLLLVLLSSSSLQLSVYAIDIDSTMTVSGSRTGHTFQLHHEQRRQEEVQEQNFGKQQHQQQQIKQRLVLENSVSKRSQQEGTIRFLQDPLDTLSPSPSVLTEITAVPTASPINNDGVDTTIKPTITSSTLTASPSTTSIRTTTMKPSSSSSSLTSTPRTMRPSNIVLTSPYPTRSPIDEGGVKNDPTYDPTPSSVLPALPTEYPNNEPDDNTDDRMITLKPTQTKTNQEDNNNDGMIRWIKIVFILIFVIIVIIVLRRIYLWFCRCCCGRGLNVNDMMTVDHTRLSEMDLDTTIDDDEEDRYLDNYNDDFDDFQTAEQHQVEMTNASNKKNATATNQQQQQQQQQQPELNAFDDDDATNELL